MEILRIMNNELLWNIQMKIDSLNVNKWLLTNIDKSPL